MFNVYLHTFDITKHFVVWAIPLNLAFSFYARKFVRICDSQQKIYSLYIFVRKKIRILTIINYINKHVYIIIFTYTDINNNICLELNSNFII